MVADPDTRPDPDALIEAVSREGKGRLKIFLGAAPGVGKTWEMLVAARRLRDEGRDVLAGIIETHGRAETEAQLGDMPVLPRRAIAYRGQVLKEFDLDAALERRPQLLLVDELAHTNAPGSRHHKRWEDVAEVLEAGLDVWATLNVQHLESLNDSVARITGVRVTETVPDKVLDMADEIELIDLPPAELRARLTEGRIYPAATANRALEGFFREGNLRALREIALRRAAQHVDADVTDYMRANAIPGPWPAGERVLALVGDGRSGETVVRHAKRLAEALHASLVALHVEQPGAALEGGSAMALAAQLDAELEAIVGRDVVAAALALAQKRNVTQIVVGRTTHALWRRLLRRSLSQQLLSRAPEFALHVVPLARDLERTGRAREKPKPPIFAWAVAAVLVCAVIGLGEGLRGILDHEALGMVFLAAVVGSASLYGLPVGLFAAALGFVSWNFFFIPPVYHFSIYAPRDIIAILVFAGVAAATGVLASRVRAEARVAQARIEGLRRIAGFSRRLGAPTTEPDLLDEIARQAAGVAGAAVVLTQMGEDLNIRAAEPPADTMDDAGWAAARWAYGRGDPTGNGTGTLPSSRWRFQPMKTLRGNVGVLGVRSERSLDAPALQAIATLADQAAVAVERVRLANEFARSAAHAETQRLRTALLSSLSHDLRTPLTGIRGAAETLRTSWSSLDDSTRQDLLRSIEDDTERMTRFLSNIMEMTRLESGAITPRRVAVELAEVVDAAIARTPGSPEVFVTLPPGQTVVADPTLLEQVLVNILDNAVKYAPAGSPITVSAEQAQNGLTLRIADQGYGISEADLPHIFDSFYRATRGDRTAPGTGLGLAIARGLIEAMGGAIDAMSPKPEGGAGTVIVLRIPRP